MTKVDHIPTEPDIALLAFLDAAVEGIIAIDVNGLVQYLNPSAQRQFGYAPAELIGRNVSILMPPPFQQEHDQYIAHYLSTGQKKIIGIGREVVGVHRDGRPFPIDLSVSEGTFAGRPAFFGTIRDITDRKRAESALQSSKADTERALAELQRKTDELKAMTQQLWQAAKLASVGELSASIAHELNNPLATVILRVESLLAKTAADDPRRRPLEIIDQESHRMAELVSNLLQFCRRSGEQSSTLDVREELDKALELVQHHLRKRSIVVTKELADDTPTLFADRQKLRQVFLNLLTNAGDAMGPGGRLTIRAVPTRLDSTKAGILLEFADTGVGIPDELLDKVMEPFFSTKEEGQGTGLGLAICKRIVLEHEGTIQIASQIGQGTTVRIVLPAGAGVNTKELRG